MTEITIFNKPEFGRLRTLEIDGEPWFVGKDVAEALGYQNPQRAMEMGLFEIKETAIPHSDGHITVSLTPKVSGKGQKYFVNQFLQGVKQDV